MLTHQHLDQLPRELAAGIAANARNKVCFTLSPKDARELAHHLGPILTDDDLAHLGRFQIACRLIADGEETPGFTLRTHPLPPAVPGRADQLRASARERYGRTREQRHGDELRRARRGRLRPNDPDRPDPRRRVSVGVSSGVSVGVSAGVLRDANGNATPEDAKPQATDPIEQTCIDPDSWDKP
ncbi:MAG: hypothetical protein GEV03_07050 [Streptosporangiales bacterium]|nr:hypothetical protein [Streptosporangiales bacterium]